MNTQPPNDAPLFDLISGLAKKEEGKALAAANRHDLLEIARDIAVRLAKEYGTVTADDVGRELEKDNIRVEDVGPAMGSLFAGKQWEFTGQRVKSSRVSNHARELKVWRLK